MYPEILDVFEELREAAGPGRAGQPRPRVRTPCLCALVSPPVIDLDIPSACFTGSSIIMGRQMLASNRGTARLPFPMVMVIIAICSLSVCGVPRAECFNERYH